MLFIILFVLIQSFTSVAAQEAILSENAEYFGFLELAGLVERPTLNYRTLSDDRRSPISKEHPWDGVQLSRARKLGPLQYRVYGPELFSSYNTAFPHGINDGAMWQGVGLNTSVTTGIRLEAFGFEATVKPIIVWEENRDFEILPSDTGYHNPYAYFWGPNAAQGIDLPQRPGNDHQLVFDWGDTEIRYTLGTFTVGFGTQDVWLGPARRNPILFSNNAPSFPKLDVGFRKTWTQIGDLEARALWGYLSPSDYFDAPGSEHNLLTALSISWAPSALPGLTLGFHRTVLSKWSDYDFDVMIALIQPTMRPALEPAPERDRRDQRASVSVDYLLPAAGIEVYLEWALNDFSPSLDYIIRYPFHTQAYTAGLRKLIQFSENKRILGLISAEITDLEFSEDSFVANLYSSFYMHHIIVEGYTNEGQIIGAGIGSGGNSQYLGFSLYYPRGRATIYVQRINRDNDYVYFVTKNGWTYNAELTMGAETAYFFAELLQGTLRLAYCQNHNPLYKSEGDKSTILNNFYLALGLRVNL